MPLKTSYFKKEMWKQSFHSSGWIGIAYFVALFFILPLEILMRLTQEENQHFTYSHEDVDNLFYMNVELQIIICLIVPVFAAIFTCRYMQVKGSADFIHSLPLKRSQLFSHQFVWGYMMLLLPIVIITFLLFVMYGVVDVHEIYQHQDIWNWFVMVLTINTFIYSVAFLIGILTGISTVQGLLSYIFLIFPAGIIILIAHNIDMLLFGFDGNYMWDINVTNISPLTRMLDMPYQSDLLANSQLIYYWCITIICIVLAYWLYKIRDVESANQSLAFPILKPIFKFGVTFCFMLLGGGYFGTMQGNVVGWLLFGYIFGALLGYILAEMLIQKTWRIFHQWKGFIVYIGISLIVLSSFVFDWFGYETMVPNQEEIEEVFIGDNMMFHQMEKDEANITEPRLMQYVMDMHQYIVDNERFNNHNRNVYGSNATDITITYFLENGRELHRSYYVPNRDDIQHYLEPVVESESYKRSSAAWLYNEEKQFETMMVNGMNGTKEIVNKDMILNVREALKMDYLTASYEEIRNSWDKQTKWIEFVENDTYYYLPLLSSFENTNELLKEENVTD